MKKPSIIDRLLARNKTVERALNAGVCELEGKNLMRLLSVMSERGLLNNSIIDQLGNRGLDSATYLKPVRYLKGLDEINSVYFCIGVAKLFKNNIKEFIVLERALEKHIVSFEIDKAILVLNEIESSFGDSIWSNKIRLSLNGLAANDRQLESNGYSDFVKLILKNHQQWVSEKDSSDAIYQAQLDFFKTIDDQATSEWIKYQILSDFSGVGLNYKQVLLSELSGTLVDFFKSIESACFQKIFSDNEQLKSTCRDFLIDVGLHHLYLKYEDSPIVINRDLLSIFDLYTAADYVGVVEEMGSIEISHMSDIGLFSIYAKSLSFLRCRLVGKHRLHINLNRLADVFEKFDGFQDSANKIINYCRLFPGLKFYQDLLRVVMHECNTLVEREDFDLRLLSNIPTPIRLGLQYEKKFVDRVLDENDIFGAARDLYECLNADSDIDHFLVNSRFLKYHGKNLIEKGMFLDAVEVYEKGSYSDPSIYRDYLYSLIMSQKTLSAAALHNSLLIRHIGSEEYFSFHELHEMLYRMAFRSDSILIPITLYRYRNVCRGSKNQAATAVAVRSYLNSIGKARPSDIELGDDPNAVYFLQEVCNRETLIKSMIFSYQSDAYDERIRICNLLSQSGIGNTRKALFEAKELSKKKVLTEAEKQVSNSKVYADKDYVRTETWEEFESEFDNYMTGGGDGIDMHEIYTSLSNREKENEKIEDKEFIESFLQQISFVSNIGGNKYYQLFYPMIRIVVEGYCYGVKGLDTYLGTRIRHGNIETTLLLPLSKIALYHDGEVADDNDFLNMFDFVDSESREKILISQKKLNSNFLCMIKDFVDNLIHVSTNSNFSEKAAFKYEVRDRDLQKFIEQSRGFESPDDFWNLISVWIDSRTEIGCVLIQEELDKFTVESMNLLSEFEQDLQRYLKNYHYRLDTKEVFSCLGQAKRSMSTQVNIAKSWFEFDRSIYSQDYDVGVVVDIVQNMVGIDVKCRGGCRTLNVPNSMLSPMVDIIYNIVGNVVRHSGMPRNEIDVYLDVIQEEDFVRFNVSNSTRFSGNIDRENKRLSEFVDEKVGNNLKPILQSNGGTGIARIIAVLKNDLSFDPSVEMKYTGVDNFICSVCIDSESGIGQV